MVSRISLPIVVTTDADASESYPDPARFALLEIRVPGTFRPAHHRHLPAMVACWLTHRQARDLAISLNREVLETGSGAWHCLAVTGRKSYGVLRVDSQQNYPSEPDGMPNTLMNLLEGETAWKNDALASCDATNKAILQLARRPGAWNVVIRALTDPTPEEAPPLPTTAGKPGPAGPVGPEREHSQDIRDWGTPANWQTKGYPVRTGGAN